MPRATSLPEPSRLPARRPAPDWHWRARRPRHRQGALPVSETVPTVTFGSLCQNGAIASWDQTQPFCDEGQALPSGSEDRLRATEHVEGKVLGCVRRVGNSQLASPPDFLLLSALRR